MCDTAAQVKRDRCAVVKRLSRALSAAPTQRRSLPGRVRTVLASYTGIGLADGETVRAISAIVSVSVRGASEREGGREGGTERARDTDTLRTRLSRNKRGALVLITRNCLRDQWLLPTNEPANQPTDRLCTAPRGALLASTAYNEIRYCTVTIIIALALTRRRDYRTAARVCLVSRRLFALATPTTRGSEKAPL